MEPPKESDQADIFGIHLCKITLSSDVSIGKLAFLTEGYTGLIYHKSAGKQLLQLLKFVEFLLFWLFWIIFSKNSADFISYAIRITLMLQK